MKRWSLEIAAGVVALGAVLLHLGFSRPVVEPPDFLLFLGRMHPLVVHLPIGAIVLVGLLEMPPLFRRRSGDVLDGALDIILPFAVLTSLVAFGLGLLLAQDGGFSEERLTLHRRLALCSVVLSCLQSAVWFTYRRRRLPRIRWLYRATMVMAVLALSSASHQGGTLSRGEAYLSKYAPEFLKPLVGVVDKRNKSRVERPAASTTEPELLSDAVEPLLEKYCVECHGEEKVKGGLRVDSLAALKKGGDTGTALVPFSGVDSLLISRMLLPEGDDDRMPPEGRPAPSPGETALIQFWVDRGARSDLKLRDLLAPVGARKSLERALSRSHTSTSDKSSLAGKNSTQSEQEEGPEGEDVKSSHERSDAASNIEANKKERLNADPVLPPETGAFAILQIRCGDCHGSSKQKGKLRVDSIAALERGGVSGAAVVWGDPATSRLVQSMRFPLGHPDHMPPKKKPQLQDKELARIESWIASRRGRPPASTTQLPRETKPRDEAKQSGKQPETEGFVGAGEVAGAVGGRVSDSACLAPSGEAPRGEVWLFDEVVGPLLLSKCGDCHAADLASGGLKLDSCGAVHEGGNEGPSVVSGVPVKSSLVRRAELPSSHDEHMPPEDFPQLTAEELNSVKYWISEGATRSVTAAWERVPTEAQRRLLKEFPERFSQDERESQEQAAQEVPPSGPPASSAGFLGCQWNQTTSSPPYWFLLLLAGVGFSRGRRCGHRTTKVSC